MANEIDNWTIQARKGILELAVLTSLAKKERYAYELIKSLTSLPGLDVSEGTIYPLLSRLRVQGLVKTRLAESQGGATRKYYSLTKEGIQTLSMMEDYLDSILNGVRTLRKRKD
jgi:PadR family transcriptional regulator, regulatory protein PadR